MDRVDQMDKMDFSALLRPCGPCGPPGPLKTLFAHLTAEAIPFRLFLSQTVDKPYSVKKGSVLYR